MKITKFEDIISWQKSKVLAVDMYSHFHHIKDLGFKNQIQRAVISISNNIAEGFERKGNQEFKRFLYIAKGSCAELRSMLYIAKELGYMKQVEFLNFLERSNEISKLLSGLIKTL